MKKLLTKGRPLFLRRQIVAAAASEVKEEELQNQTSMIPGIVHAQKRSDEAGDTYNDNGIQSVVSNITLPNISKEVQQSIAYNDNIKQEVNNIEYYNTFIKLTLFKQKEVIRIFRRSSYY